MKKSEIAEIREKAAYYEKLADDFVERKNLHSMHIKYIREAEAMAMRYKKLAECLHNYADIMNKYT